MTQKKKNKNSSSSKTKSFSSERLQQLRVRTLASDASHAATPSAQVVGNAFVHQYYQILTASPEMVYRFYQDSSVLSRPDANGKMSSVTTMQGINEKILTLKEYKAEIETFDAQKSHMEGVTVLVTGSLTDKDNLRRKFAQSFFLAPQDKGYFVLNDVFRYVDDYKPVDNHAVSGGVSSQTVPSIPDPEPSACVEVPKGIDEKAIDAAESDKQISSKNEIVAKALLSLNGNEVSAATEPVLSAAEEDSPKKSFSSEGSSSCVSDASYAATPSAQVVGNAFVEQYYHILHTSPELVYRFYQDSSVLSRPDASGKMSSVTTMQGINEKILSLNFKDCKAEIKSADAQKSHMEGVTVLVTGSLTDKDNLRKKFAQSFFLAPQDIGYFVLNDVFSFVDDNKPEDNHAVSGGVSSQTLPSIPDPESSHVSDPSAPESSACVEVPKGVDEKAIDAAESDKQISSKNEIVAKSLHSLNGNEVSAGTEPVPSAAEEDAPKKSYASIDKVAKGSSVQTKVYMHTNTSRMAAKKSESHPVPPAPEPRVPAPAQAPSSDDIRYNIDTQEQGYYIYVRNLPYTLTADQLEAEFKNFGPIKQLGIQVRFNKQRRFCFGFVEFLSRSSLNNALQLMDANSDCTSDSSETRTDLHDSIWGNGGSRSYGEPLLEVSSSTSSSTDDSNLPQKVLESLFKIPESSERDQRSMNWKNVVKKMQSLCPNLYIQENNDTSPLQESCAGGEEYHVYRKSANQLWDSVNSYRKKAAVAYSNGEKELASYLSNQREVETKKAWAADQRASQLIFQDRNKDRENVITIDMHGQHVKPAMRLLKLHLLFGTYAQSIQTLRVITGHGSHGHGKSKVKQSITSLLEKEGVRWTEENRGTLLIKVEASKEYSFMDSDSDTE